MVDITPSVMATVTTSYYDDAHEGVLPLMKGEEVEVIEKAGEWWYVATHDRRMGYFPECYLSVYVAPMISSVYVQRMKGKIQFR